MPGIILALISGVSSFFGGLFNFKGQQAETVQSALGVLKSINDVDGQSATAAAQALSAILTQGSFLEKNWRPVLMVVLMGILIASFFGYIPSHLNDPVSPTMDKVWTLLQIGLGGYLPLRTIEKVMQQVNISSILKELIRKKVG